MARRHHYDDDDEPREHIHRTKGSFGTGFGLGFGCLCAIVFFFFGVPILMCAGCFAGLFGVSEAAKAAKERAAEVRAEQERREEGRILAAAHAVEAERQKKAKEAAEAARPIAVGEAVVLTDPSGFAPVADTEKTLELFRQAEQDKKEGIVLDFLKAETVVRVPNDTRAKVVEVGVGVVKLTITGGFFDGRTGYAPGAAASRPEKK